ncbi:MAG: sulfatase-like hydrolase/transferase [Myxococcota bacterium]
MAAGRFKRAGGAADAQFMSRDDTRIAAASSGRVRIAAFGLVGAAGLAGLIALGGPNTLDATALPPSGPDRTARTALPSGVAKASGATAKRASSPAAPGVEAPAGVALPALPTGPPAPRASGARPNVVVVTLDTTRADRLGSYGADVETPALDAIAARGARFTHAISSAPVTLPSHASLFTGLDPHRHGARENGTYVLADAQLTLAEILRSQGWRTGAFIGGFPLSERFGLGQGFDHYDDALAEDNAAPPRADSWQGIPRPYLDRPAGPVVRRAIRWMHANAETSFFAWIHLFDAHKVYAPPEPFRTRYRDRLYEGEIAYMDFALGELFRALSDWGLEDETIVVIGADHGESLGEHGIHGHGRQLYAPSLHVPLIAAFPGRIEEGTVVEDVVRNVDVMPTLLELLELAVPPGLDGASLVAAIEGADDRDATDAYAETLVDALRFDGAERYALQRGTWKLLREVAPDGAIRERLFDLSADPAELTDRALRAPEAMADLVDALDERIARAERDAGPAALDPATEAALRALGYLVE